MSARDETVSAMVEARRVQARRELVEELASEAGGCCEECDTVVEMAGQLAEGDVASSIFPWATALDSHDRADFLDELAAAAITHADTSIAMAEVEATCARWREIAAIGPGKDTRTREGESTQVIAEYGVRAPAGEVAWVTSHWSVAAGRVAACRSDWPDAQLMRRTVMYSSWVADGAGEVQ